MYLSIHLSIYVSIYLCICLFIYLFIYMCTCMASTAIAPVMLRIFSRVPAPFAELDSAQTSETHGPSWTSEI